LAVRWYLRYGLSYRDVEELLGERGSRSTTSPSTGGCSASRHFWPMQPGRVGTQSATVGSSTRPTWRSPANGGTSTGPSTSTSQIIDVLVSVRRDLRAARRFFAQALRAHGEPAEVVTDRAPALRTAIEGLLPAAFHNTEHYANNRVECDHGRL